jgi:very-short-patch-repair endonuclease
MEVHERVSAMGGTARTADLLVMGYTKRQLSAAVKSRRLTRVGRGMYGAPGVKADRLLATRLGAREACVSALQQYGVALLRKPTQVHLEVPLNFSAGDRDTSRARLHYSTAASFARATTRTSVLDALATATKCMGKREQLVALDSALHLGLVQLSDIARWGANHAGRAGIQFKKERREWLVAFADARSESPLETLVRVDVAEAGFAVQPQVHVKGVGRVDLVVEGVIVLELDGREHHDNPRAFQQDRERDRRLAKRGFRVLRYTYADLMGPQPVDVVADIRETLAFLRKG